MTLIERMEEQFEAEGSCDLSDMRVLFAAARAGIALSHAMEPHDNRNAPVGVEQVRIPSDVWGKFHAATHLLEKSRK
jgi:hypothetical protein